MFWKFPTDATTVGVLVDPALVGVVLVRDVAVDVRDVVVCWPGFEMLRVVLVVVEDLLVVVTGFKQLPSAAQAIPGGQTRHAV